MVAAPKVAGRRSKIQRLLETTAPPPPPAYVPPDVEGERFLHSKKFVTGIRGPFGSGKSVLCCHRILKHCQEQEPWDILDTEGKVVRRVRYSRWAVIRNTFPELKLTTVKTWRDWVPDALGEFAWSAPFTHHLNYQMPDGTWVDAEIIFLAVDKPDDVKKLLSLELTGAFINEAREVAKEIVDMVTGRVGRYPSPAKGGPSWYGVIMDTNSPGEEHWWPIMAGDVEPPEYLTDEEKANLIKPADWEFFTQPPAMLERFDDQGRVVGYDINPDRANKAMPDEYYYKLISGKSRQFIVVYVLNRYATLISGRVVYPDWRDDQHLSPKAFEPDPNYTIFIGIDYGRTPAAVFLQYIERQVRVFDELLLRGVSTITFAKSLQGHIARRGWFGYTIKLYGDPSGDDMKETADEAPSQIMARQGLVVLPAATNDPLIRIEAVSALLSLLLPVGPGLLVSPRCHGLIAGFRGGYHFKPIGGIRTGVFDSRPSKNPSSHPHDALQYDVIGCGAWRPAIGMDKDRSTPTVANRSGSVMTRLAARSASRWNRKK